MTQSILLACCLTAFAAAACAQAPEKAAAANAPATSEASPLVVSGSRKLDLDAKEPRGLLLKMDGPKPGYLRAEWGATRQALVQAMTALSGRPADDIPRCSEQHGETVCVLKGESGWLGEPGLASMAGELPVAFLFSPAGELYHYKLLGAKESAEEMRSVLKKELGDPAKEQLSPRMTGWNLGHTSVVLQEHPDSIELNVIYAPIAETTQ